ncbi:MAG: hypothetical protein SGI97_10740, partial [candidate division Zixibacteria bacterium]|nr:hypothetical protein [candidate division Zixibacteria bacterium]
MSQSSMSKKGSNSTKFLLGAIGIVVVAVVAISFTGWPPFQGDASGTIGAAKKYQAEQITNADVSLDSPEIQAILQNDQVQALLKDENFRKAIASEQFRSSLVSMDFRNAMLSEDFRNAIAQETFRNAIATESFRACI